MISVFIYIYKIEEKDKKCYFEVLPATGLKTGGFLM